MKSKLFKIMLLFFLILMLIFPTNTLIGAKSGLLLWFNTVLPTLLPFIILSNLLIKFNVSSLLCRIFSPIITKIFHVSKNGTYPIIIGLFSGYPIGAKACSDLLNKGDISKSEGQFLLCFCNNASIMFITSFVAISNLDRPSYRYLLLLFIYISAFMSAMILKLIKNKKINNFKKIVSSTYLNKQTLLSSSNIKSNNSKTFSFTIIDECILDGFEIITKVGGYILFFSILSQIVLDCNFINSYFKLFIAGILEITTGVHTIALSPLNESTKIVLITAVTAFGGLSSIAQTKSVIASSGLSIKEYIKSKILNSFIATLFALLYVIIFI